MNHSEISSEDTSDNSFDFNPEEYRNYQFTTEASFISHLKRVMSNSIPSMNRAELQKQKIRQALVRDYIQNKDKQPDDIRRVLRDLFESWYY